MPRRLALILALLLVPAACDPAALSPWGGYKMH